MPEKRGHFYLFTACVLGMAAASCATIPITGDPAVEVFAVAETEPVGTANEDAADDPSIWRNAADPAASLIVATDKKAGLYVYDLNGTTKSFLTGAGLNNVDLIEMGDGRVLVAASDRADAINAHVFLAWLDTSAGKLTPAGRYPVGSGEAYGLCAAGPDPDGSVTIYSPLKDGSIYRTILMEGDGGEWQAASSLLHTLASQPEGCVVDPRTATLYVGEEAAGIWAFNLDAGSHKQVATIDNRQLVADVEGLALAPMGEDGGYLIASSQGDNTYARYALPDMTPMGRFRIAESSAHGSTEETDGIALMLGDFGPKFAGGLFIAQDGANEPEAQNFKLVPWTAIEEAFAQWQPTQDQAPAQ